MKKVLVALLVFVLATGSIFAADTKGVSKDGSFGIGANLGSDLGVYMDWGMGIFDLDVIAGLNFPGYRGIGVFGEVGANFAILDFAKIGDGFPGSFPFSIGVAALAGVGIGETVSFELEILAPFKFEYTFPKAPWSLFLRLAPGFGMWDNFKHLGFAFEGSLGFTYNF